MLLYKTPDDSELCSTDVRHNIKIFNSTVKASETTGNLSFDFDVANIKVSLIVVKGNGKVS